MLNLERLRVLHAVSAHGSLRAAAEALNVTASAVSQQLARLEREVGETLLEPRGRGIGLTDAAALLAEHAARALSVLTEAEAELEARRSTVAGSLTLAAFATAARGLAPATLRRLAADYPELEVSLQEIEPRESLPLLLRGDLADIALPAGHPAAGRETIELAELAADRWISWPQGSICHDWLLHTLRGLGREPRIRHTAAEYPTQLALVAAGLGASVLPRLGRGPIPEGVSIVAVKPALHRHVFAAWRLDATRGTAIRVVVEALHRAVG